MKVIYAANLYSPSQLRKYSWLNINIFELNRIYMKRGPQNKLSMIISAQSLKMMEFLLPKTQSWQNFGSRFLQNSLCAKA